MNTKNRTPPRAKLDNYNYRLAYAGPNNLAAVIVDISGITDVTIADISTEINVSQGRVYVEGYKVIAHSIDVDDKNNRLVLSVKPEEN